MQLNVLIVFCCLGFGYGPVSSYAEDLSTAVRKGNLPKVKAMLSHGATLGTLTLQGETTLHLTIKFGHKLSVEVLLAHGAEVNVQNAYGDTPRHSTIRQKEGILSLSKCFWRTVRTLDARNSQRWTFLPLAERSW